MTQPGRRTVSWSSRSRRDLRSIQVYIAQFAPLAAERFTLRLVSVVESLADHPDRGRPVGRLREMVAVSPYLVRYKVTAKEIQIIRIKHAAQRPE